LKLIAPLPLLYQIISKNKHGDENILIIILLILNMIVWFIAIAAIRGKNFELKYKKISLKCKVYKDNE